MPQAWPSVDGNEVIKNTRTELTDRDEAVKSCFAGSSFPGTNLVIGMLCFRTDLNQVHQLRATGPAVWVLIADLTKTYLSKEGADALYAAITHGHTGAEITSGTVAAARLPAEVQNVQAVTTGGGTLYGSINLAGLNNTYQGIHFADASVLRKFLVSSLIQGVMKSADNSWMWKWNNGQLEVGDVPWARLSSVPTNALGTRTVSTSAPSGGADGDIWYRY